jgi:hypothetical protein
MQWQALVHMIMNLQFQLKVGHSMPSQMTISFSRRTLIHGFNVVSEGLMAK